jgi:membrane protease YdiL (CAAX protease family)
MSTDPLSGQPKGHAKTLQSITRALNWRGSREVLFWLLLLGSWQFLAAPGGRNGFVGCVGTAVFLIFAWVSLDRLKELGLEHARWGSARGVFWLKAAGTGAIAGAVVFTLASLSGQGMKLSNDVKLAVLEVTLGPVLEEIVFRGYLFALLLWVLTRLGKKRWNALIVPLGALVFAVVHLSRPGTSWLQMACITSTGAVYGAIRYASGSTGPAAMAHAAYNLTLYALFGALTLLGRAPR